LGCLFTASPAGVAQQQEKRMKKQIIAGVVLSVSVAGAAGAQEITFQWIADKGVVTAGEAVTLSLMASWDPAEVGLASTIFEVLGDDDAYAASDTIDVTESDGDTQVDFLGRNPSFRMAGTNPPYVNGDDITADPTGVDVFQLPLAFNPDFNGDNPIELFRFTWVTADDAPRMITYTSIHINADVYTDDFGSSVPYGVTVLPASFAVVPTPASLAVLSLGGMAFVRRRRQS
jgi:hypothetical protein